MINKIFLLLLLLKMHLLSVSFYFDKSSLANLVKRIYNTTPFEGIKIIDDYDHQYLVSVVILEKNKYKNESIINRVAQVKAQAQANIFLNGSSITMDMVITSKDTKDSSYKTSKIVETVEQIKQSSTGFTQGLELLTNFTDKDGKYMVFIFSRIMD